MSRAIIPIDGNGQELFPLSMADATGSATSFDNNGNFSTTFANGYAYNAIFLDNGNVEETMKDSTGKQIIKRTTTFSESGINTTITVGEGE